MRVATPSPSDEEMVLEMIQAFYAEEQIVFVEERARRAVRQLTRQPECGAVLLFTLPKPAGGCGCGGNGDGGEPCCDTEVIAGYAVATIGFTLEHGGRLVLLDEFYLRRFTVAAGADNKRSRSLKTGRASAVWRPCAWRCITTTCGQRRSTKKPASKTTTAI